MKTFLTLLLCCWIESTGTTSVDTCVNDARHQLTQHTSLSDPLVVSNDKTSDSCEYYESTEVGAESAFVASFPAPKSVQDPLGSDIGLPQTLDASRSVEIKQKIEDAQRYMNKHVMVEPEYEHVRDLCQNQHASCAFWAVLGECANNPAYMNLHCAPVCRSCEQLHVATRCPLDPDAVDALVRPGDLNHLFERIATDPWYQQYEPVVLSRPTLAPGDTAQNATYQLGMWLIVFENVISDDEAERMIELGRQNGYQRSSDVGSERRDGTHENKISNGRTSSNAWCTGDCYTDPVAQRLMERVENITGIPEVNSENFQLLQYLDGDPDDPSVPKHQHYNVHNDYIPYQLERPSGVRILTFYFYLNDVEEGGGTRFPHLNMTVTPKRGRAALWPSVLDEHPNEKDGRSDHEALPVLKGEKYGCNAWIHQRDFKTPNNRGC